MPGAYYNEFDPFAAECLRQLIKAGHIAPGDVDERSILDVRPDDLKGYVQHHFFAGIGGWSLALRLSGIADDEPCWTGSCPCQPFSAAGKGLGFDDERHLWPAWYWLIDQLYPAKIFGEQVASKAVEPWIDLVQSDLEALGYAFGCVPFPAAGVGAPHIRDRAYWFVKRGGGMDHPVSPRLEGLSGYGNDSTGRQESPGSIAAPSATGELADAEGNGRANGAALDGSSGSFSGATEQIIGIGNRRTFSSLADATGGRCGIIGDSSQPGSLRHVDGSKQPSGQPGPINGFWRDADWLSCRDGKWRPVEPGTSPLATGVSARVGRLRGYGNAINIPAAVEFIKACEEA